MTLSIIIVNFKVLKETLNCINSIIKTTKNITYEIIVVDNEGNKNLEIKLKKYKNIKYINPGKNLGYGAGNNLGVKFANGEFIFILNPDTVLEDSAIDNIFKFINNKKNIGVVAPLLLDKNKKIYPLQGVKVLTPKKAIFSLTFLSKIFKNNKIEREYLNKDWDKKNNREVDVVPGTAFVIKRELFIKIGGFDEKYFLYFEEFDLCKRLKEKGYRNYIAASSKVVHEWEASTSKIKDRNKIFSKSRFYYFKKNYGLFWAIIVNLFSKINKNVVILLTLFIYSTFVVTYSISESMQFIGDQAWFYLSARDMLIYQNIPLVGITSSHIWLHQGPLWTYLLSPFLLLFKFNLVGGIFLSIVLNLLTICVLYIFSKQIFNEKVALIASVLYATSPLVINFSRMPYHTTPIPLFTILFMHALYNWIKGNKKYFPLIFLYLSILYNFELATFSLLFIFIIFIAYGFIKKTFWLKKVLNKATLSLALLFFLIPMTPVIYYDIYNGFAQTIKFPIWVGYKIVNFVYPLGSSAVSSTITFRDSFLFLFNTYQNLIFPLSILISGLILLATIIFLIYSLFNQKVKQTILFLIIWLVVGIANVIITKTLSDAYLPIIFPVVIIITAYLYSEFLSIKKLKLAFYIIFGLLVLSNIRFLFTSDVYLKNNLKLKNDVVSEIISDSKGQSFNIIGKGNGSQFRSFTMPYEYLFWYYGKPISNKDQKLKYSIEEIDGRIIISK